MLYYIKEYFNITITCLSALNKNIVCSRYHRVDNIIIKETQLVMTMDHVMLTADLEEIDAAYTKMRVHNNQLMLANIQLEKKCINEMKRYEEINRSLNQDLDDCHNRLKCLKDQIYLDKAAFKTQRSLLEQDLELTRTKVREQKIRIDCLEKQMIEKDDAIEKILVEFEEFKLNCQKDKEETNDYIMRLEQEKAQIAKLVSELEKHKTRQGERALEFLCDNFSFICQNMTSSTSLADEIAITDSLEHCSIESSIAQDETVDNHSNGSCLDDDISTLNNSAISQADTTIPGKMTKIFWYTLRVVILIGVSPFVFCMLLSLYFHIFNDHIDSTSPRYNDLSPNLMETFSHIIDSYSHSLDNFSKPI